MKLYIGNSDIVEEIAITSLQWVMFVHHDDVQCHIHCIHICGTFMSSKYYNVVHALREELVEAWLIQEME